MKSKVISLTLGLCATLVLVGCSRSGTNTTGRPGTEEAVKDAIDVYIYGYPLVTMDMTRKSITNYETVQGSRGPMGQIIKLRTYPAVDDHAVTAPNADTLYTTAFIDVSKEPWVFGRHGRPLLPDAHAGWLDRCFPSSRQAHDGRQSAEVRHHRTRVVRHFASGSH